MTAFADEVARARLDDLEDDVVKLETSHTRHRDQLATIERYLAEIRGPITWGLRLTGIIAVAILGTFGTLLWAVLKRGIISP